MEFDIDLKLSEKIRTFYLFLFLDIYPGYSLISLFNIFQRQHTRFINSDNEKQMEHKNMIT